MRNLNYVTSSEKHLSHKTEQLRSLFGLLPFEKINFCCPLLFAAHFELARSLFVHLTR
jgi:hypothetical protein